MVASEEGAIEGVDEGLVDEEVFGEDAEDGGGFGEDEEDGGDDGEGAVDEGEDGCLGDVG